MVRVALALLGLAVSGLAYAQDLDTVEIDVDSGTTDRKLPFDVPFLLEGDAPAGSIEVEVSYRDLSTGEESPPYTSTTGVDGRFRVRLGPFDADRDFRFQLVFDRRLSSAETAELRREVEASLDRNLASIEGEMSREVEARLKTELRLAFERALNRGQPFSPGRGDLAVESRGQIFSENGTSDDLESLVRVILDRQAERGASLRRYRDTAPNLERELARLRASGAVEELVSELERRPELDPRNPRNALFLSEAALEVTRERETAAIESLDDTLRAEEADAVRSGYVRLGRALRELRDWLTSVVVPGAAHHTVWERIGGTEANLAALQELIHDEASSLRRAERWTEVLESYVHDLERSLLARERALGAAANDVVSRALSARIRQTTTTDVLTTRANLYVGLDLGALYSPELERAAAYFGANIYFGPVNKRASLSYAGGLKRRLSVTVGLTVSELVLEDDPRVEPLLGSRYNLAFGLGYRFARSLRVSGGTLLVLKNDPNPLVTERTLAWTPYVAFSFDIDVVGALRAAAK